MKTIEVKNKIINDLNLKEALKALSGTDFYLVGGYIRDLFFDKVSCDYDLVCPTDSRAAAVQLKEYFGGTFIELDNENKIYRVVLSDKKTFFDVSEALNNNISDDAKRRDFTINSIFFDFNNKQFFDPFGGINAIEKKIIETSDINNLFDDSLRMLRALRFSSLLGFSISSDIKNFIKNNAKMLLKCAPERINHEIIELFSGKYLTDSIIKADECGLLEVIFPFVKDIKKVPKNSHHHLDLFHHSLETVRQIRINNPLLKLAAFCHDIGKPSTFTIDETGRHRFLGHDEKGARLVEPVLRELKFSKKQIEYISLLVKYHMYPSLLMSEREVKDKAKIRFVRKLEPYTKDVIELARADRLAARGPEVTDEMVEKNLENLAKLLEFYREIKPKLEALPKLLDGHEVMQILNVKPSPILGNILNALKEAQIEGKVKTKEEAKEFIMAFCKEM